MSVSDAFDADASPPPAPADLRKLAAEIEAEVRARRAAGEYPPGFERDLDALFERFAPPEVSNDFDAALERAEDLTVVDPVIPVASRNPAFGSVKRIVAKLIGWYHVWLAQQITALATGINTALRQLGTRVKQLEHATGDIERARAIAGSVAAIRDDARWSDAVVDALAGRSGRVAVVHCGDGALLAALVAAGLDAYGVEPLTEAAHAARERGLEVRNDDGNGHLNAVGDGALDGLVLRALVERAPLGELLVLLDGANRALQPGGRLVICSLTRAVWGTGTTAAEADLVTGHPLHPDTWVHILREHEFTDVEAEIGEDAYVIRARRART
jgi:SAM-dependent methyltransferase